MWDDLWLNGRLATMVASGADQGAASGAAYGAIEDGALAVQDGKIAWVGPAGELPGPPESLARERHDLEGRWVTPGLIDCHTHLVYGGDRAREFELRLEGATYEELARAGGGIVSTVKATRQTSEDQLVEGALPRLEALLAEGVTTVEIKSGYGLELASELKQLRAARRLGARLPVTIKTTFLGAHALPPEFAGRADDYIDSVVAMMPEVAGSGLADAVDGFCDSIGFTPEQTARVFTAAAAQGLPVKLHADQLTDLGGAALAARFGALSADHLEFTSEAGAAAMAKSGSVAVLLPGAFYFLRETKLPPIPAFRSAGVPIALATDSNPGSSPITSLLLVINMACTLFRLTPEEALAGITVHGARALGLSETHGTLEVGKAADLAIWDIERPAELAYRIGFNPLAGVVKDGRMRSPQ
jgi:imidazolonepropionase